MTTKMKPPVGVLAGMGAGGATIYVQPSEGFAHVDDTHVASLLAAGWTKVAHEGDVFDPSSVAITGGTIAGNKLLRINNGTRQLRIIPFGDSITQSSSVQSSGLWQYGIGYAETGIYQAGPRYQIVRNAGISGNTTTQMLARLGTDVLAYSPDVVLMCGGRNDIVASMSNAQIATCMGNLESMARQMLQAGILPIIVTPPASSNTPVETRKLIPFYYSLAQAYGLPLIDLFRITVDPATGNYLTGYSGDGTHPNPTAVTAIAPFVAATLNNLAGSFCPPYMAYVAETAGNQFANLFKNGNFANVTTPPTPDTWTVNGATQTVVAANISTTSPYNGNTFNYNKGAAGGAYALSGYGPTIGSGNLSVGDTILFTGHMNVSGNAPATAAGFTLGLDMVGVGGNYRPFTQIPYNGDFVFSGTFVVPTGCTWFTPTLYVQDVATYKVNNLTAFNLTTANAIWTPSPA